MGEFLSTRLHLSGQYDCFFHPQRLLFCILLKCQFSTRSLSKTKNGVSSIPLSSVDVGTKPLTENVRVR